MCQVPFAHTRAWSFTPAFGSLRIGFRSFDQATWGAAPDPLTTHSWSAPVVDPDAGPAPVTDVVLDPEPVTLGEVAAQLARAMVAAPRTPPRMRLRRRPLPRPRLRRHASGTPSPPKTRCRVPVEMQRDVVAGAKERGRARRGHRSRDGGAHGLGLARLGHDR